MSNFCMDFADLLCILRVLLTFVVNPASLCSTNCNRTLPITACGKGIADSLLFW